MHRSPPLFRVRPFAVIAALATLTTLASPATSEAAAATGTWLPPAYLVWRTGGLPPGLTPVFEAMTGVRDSVVVDGDVLWMVRSVRASGAIVERAPLPMKIPIDAMAVAPKAYVAFIPNVYRDEVRSALGSGSGVLGESSAALRRLRIGDRMVFPGGVKVEVGAIVPDAMVAWSELMVSRPKAASLGIRHARFALLRMAGSPTPGRLARRVGAKVGPGYPVVVRRPGQARFRRQGDSTLPQVLMKRTLGEFAARPDPSRPGYLLMSGAYVRDHLATRSVPLLGRFTCNRELFGPLIAAMRELRARGLGWLIRNFAGCYNARMVMRRPTGALSHHSWGGAVDINSITNPYGAPPHQDRRLVNAMLAQGFTWGGTWRVPDGMHFDYEGRGPVAAAAPVP